MGNVLSGCRRPDDLGLLALRFLRRKGIRLPRDLSLVSFDDTIAGYTNGLTSYNFNIPAIVNAMVEHVLAPNRAGWRGRVVEISGMVLERQTSSSVNAELRM